MKNPVPKKKDANSTDSGFSLMEIIVAMLLLSIAIVPMISAYGPAIFTTAGEEEAAVFTNQVRATISRVMVLDFNTLKNNPGNPVDLVSLFGSAEEAAKKTFSFKGENYTPTVAIADVSGGDGEVFELTVTLQYVTLKTLKADY